MVRFENLKPNNFQSLKRFGRQVEVLVRGHEKTVAVVRGVENAFQIGERFRSGVGTGKTRFGKSKPTEAIVQMRAARAEAAVITVHDQADLCLFSRKMREERRRKARGPLESFRSDDRFSALLGGQPLSQ